MILAGCDAVSQTPRSVQMFTQGNLGVVFHGGLGECLPRLVARLHGSLDAAQRFVYAARTLNTQSLWILRLT